MKLGRHHRCSAFSLIEMMVVMAILMLLTAAGISLLRDSSVYSRRSAVGSVKSLVDKARTASMVTHASIALVVESPVVAGSSCRVALVQLDSWPEVLDEAVPVAFLSRWQTIDAGIVLCGGDVDGFINPIDEQQWEIVDCRGDGPVMRVHVIGFHPGGGICYPEGSLPLVIRVAEGRYQDGLALPMVRGDAGVIPEDRISIGRDTARPWQM